MPVESSQLAILRIANRPHLSKKSAILTKSSCLKPLVVRAGVPMRTPPGMMADLSPGTLFLLRVMEARSRTLCALAPSTPDGLRSTSIRTEQHEMKDMYRRSNIAGEPLINILSDLQWWMTHPMDRQYLCTFAPPRGPLRDLWVVVVTTWECSKGSATTPAATRPDVWAISVMRYAPTLSAAFLMRA
ncbi:MAG: hypothetical protein FRX49_10366 [Trebouxia sp. A1-2]|nr:MAG: hypothetical protein FRX49_10366 [Trebouxia sp. A1-2]